VPVRDDRRLFELLLLEGAQAGLSWSIILRKRPGYRRAFAGFDPRRVARFGPREVRRLAVQAEHGSFAEYLWRFVAGRAVQNRWRSHAVVPAETDVSRALSADLRRRGFRFVGPTICYAFMQAIGLVNDHTLDCFRYRAVARLAGGPPRRLSAAGA
jgi:DNA-3-methyladenine glycosylase I